VTAAARGLVHWAALAACLGAIAWASPLPQRVTDRDIYEASAANMVVADCSDLHCFRVLVPWALGRLPGPSIVKWKTYAVAANAAAAVAVFALCLGFGLPRRAAWFASVASAFGFGSLYTLHDVYTSDPLMFLAGPLITNELLNGGIALAAVFGIAGVFAKEFAAAPFYVVAAVHAIERRWDAAARVFAAGNAALIVWLVLTLTLMLRFNYTYAGSPSTNLAGGGFLAAWLHQQSARGVASAMLNEFGALYVLAPVGFLLAPRPLRLLALTALPIAALFAYVQQPDRALWNFHFLVVPLAAIVLDRAPRLGAATLAAFAVGNLRVGAQLPIAKVGVAALAVSLVLAMMTVARALTNSQSSRLGLPRRAATAS
jgi:hypothetical protein